MKLQVAIDLVDTQGLLKLAASIYDLVDIVEVGTPVVMLEGQLPVRRLREAYPELTILDDTKIADGGALEAGYAVAAGADIMTVLAVSDDLTIQGVIQVAHEHGKKALVDLINVPDVVQRSSEVDAMGADYICVHTASDVQATGRNPLDELKAIKSVVKHAKLAAAGGINADTIHEIAAIGPEIVIIGGGITKAENPREAAQYYHDIVKAVS